MKETDSAPKSKMRLSRLFDSWNLQNVATIAVLKILQFLRGLGMHAEAAGWRKVTGIFVRNEYSKFMLASFRLNYAGGRSRPASPAAARELLIRRLAEFVREQAPLHWSVRIGRFAFSRRRLRTLDVIEAHADSSGNLLRLVPHFDEARPPLLYFSREQILFITNHIITVYNSLRYEPAKVRPARILRNLRGWTARNAGVNLPLRLKLNALVDRIMSAMFVYCEELPADPEQMRRKRFHMPNLRHFRHPGWGMLCVVARFPADYSEVDLWWQFNHVTADGAPMQEILTSLKKQWGETGRVVFPPLASAISVPDVIYCGDRVFRARVYIDFSAVRKLRTRLNEEFSTSMNGNATLAGIFLWGISAHPFLSDKKILMPVDAGMRGGERELGLLVIRPGRFRRSGTSGLASFLAFQREVNSKIEKLRSGLAESDEFLQLCTMLHPFFYHAAKHLFPDSLHEILGTVGFSMIRDSEMFISPFTDFQVNGFLSLGSVEMPTENGRTCGSLCICGSRPQIRSYLEAIRTFLADPESEFL